MYSITFHPLGPSYTGSSAVSCRQIFSKSPSHLCSVQKFNSDADKHYKEHELDVFSLLLGKHVSQLKSRRGVW